jgi:hypothetical protein
VTNNPEQNTAKDWAAQISLKTVGDLMCSGRANT